MKERVVMKFLGKEIAKSFLATLLMGSAIALFIACELGSDPITVFLDGFNRKTGVSVGITDQFLNLFLLITGYLMNKKSVGINSVVNVLVLGICIDYPASLISTFNIASQPLAIRLVCLFIAQVMFASSLAWMQTFKYGMNAMDAIIYKIMHYTNFRYLTVRILYDGTFILIGYLLGGIVGVGTVLSISTNGFFTEKAKKIIGYISGEKRS